MTARRLARLLLILTAFGLAACAPTFVPMGPPSAQTRLLDESFIAADGAELPVRVWRPDGVPRAAIIALHGFNDYSNSYRLPGTAWAKQGMIVYAYDQRGFGRAPGRGMWHGTETMVADLETAASLIHARHPDIPLYVVGESMGGAVILVAGAQKRLPTVTGVILATPAIRGRETLNVFARAGLWFFAHTIPWLAGQPGGPIYKVTDNIEALRELRRDPLVIKDTRIDTFYGLVNLMDDALDAARHFEMPALIQIGAEDDLVPDGPMELMLSRLPKSANGRQRIAIYDRGFHMLFRDLSRDIPIGDVAFWALRGDTSGPLPSGAERPHAIAIGQLRAAD